MDRERPLLQQEPQHPAGEGGQHRRNIRLDTWQEGLDGDVLPARFADDRGEELVLGACQPISESGCPPILS
jgi:hypothetical protein